MLYLIASIILSAYLVLFFKLLDKLKLDSLPVIVVNYFTCVVTGMIVNGRMNITRETVEQPWFGWAILMGITFVTLFNLIAFTARKVGVAVTSVANKLSLVIPFGFSILLYNETASLIQVIGIALAMVAVVFTCYPSEKNSFDHNLKRSMVILLPTILFLGSGLLDTMIKYVEHSFLDGTNNNDYLIMSFLSAGTIGLIVLTGAILTKKIRFNWKVIPAGIILGIPNYFSIWTLIETLKQNPSRSGVIIPVINMGIVLFSSVAAWLIFRERLSLLNWIGIVLSLIAITLIAFA
ncbi:MAG: EamA family transporter [Flavitalea sp.]